VAVGSSLAATSPCCALLPDGARADWGRALLFVADALTSVRSCAGVELIARAEDGRWREEGLLFK
jgi:hypothetical protein